MPASEASEPLGAMTYVYPQDPPVVDLDLIKRLLRGFAGYELAVFVWEAGDWRAGAWIQGLADAYRSGYANRFRVLGIVVGDESSWPDIRTNLKETGANFPCVVLSDREARSLTCLLNGAVERFPACVAIGADRETLGRVGSLESLERLKPWPTRGLLVAMPDSGDPTRRRWIISGRLLRTSTGQSVERFDITGALEESVTAAANLLADRLGKMANLGGVAVLSLHGDLGDAAVGERLAGLLSKRTSRHVIGPGQAAGELAGIGTDMMSVELNPARVSDKAGWEFVVVGLVEASHAAQTARMGKPDDDTPPAPGK